MGDKLIEKNCFSDVVVVVSGSTATRAKSIKCASLLHPSISFIH